MTLARNMLNLAMDRLRPDTEISDLPSYYQRLLMITKESAPVAWAAFMYELQDAQEHLAKLISDISSDANYDEANFRIDLGHVFSHLNRAWHGHQKANGLDEAEWVTASRFPTDLDPI